MFVNGTSIYLRFLLWSLTLLKWLRTNDVATASIAFSLLLG
jgi:hypothetical protein